MSKCLSHLSPFPLSVSLTLTPVSTLSRNKGRYNSIKKSHLISSIALSRTARTPGSSPKALQVAVLEGGSYPYAEGHIIQPQSTEQWWNLMVYIYIYVCVCVCVCVCLKIRIWCLAFCSSFLVGRQYFITVVRGSLKTVQSLYWCSPKAGIFNHLWSLPRTWVFLYSEIQGFSCATYSMISPSSSLATTPHGTPTDKDYDTMKVHFWQ